MAKDSRYGAGPEGPTPPPAVLEDLDMLSTLEPIYRVFGQPDGRGMVIRSSEPVAFNPGGKLVNVVEVGAFDDAMQHVTVATPRTEVRRVGKECVSAGVPWCTPFHKQKNTILQSKNSPTKTTKH